MPSKRSTGRPPAFLQLVQDALAVIEEATKAGAESSHWVTDPTLLSVVQELLKEVMTLKGIRVCLRPWHMATPTPQLTLKTTPLRIQVQGTVKHWVMEEMEDLTTYSPSQIGRAIDIDDWQITLFGSETSSREKEEERSTDHSRRSTEGKDAQLHQLFSLLEPRHLQLLRGHHQFNQLLELL